MITREFVLAGRAIFTVANGKGERYTSTLSVKSKLDLKFKPLAVLAWSLRIVDGKTELPPNYGMFHAGRCGRCGRLLTTPESIESGLGPDCITKIEGLRHVQRTEANAAHRELG